LYNDCFVAAANKALSMRIAIVGGGISGLVAAFYLRRADPTTEVHVIESADRLGGVILTQRVGGYLLEHGADMFATQPADAVRLCEDLGISGQMITPQPGARGAAIVCRGKLVKIPDGFVLMRPTRIASMLTTKLLSPGAKLRLLCEGLIKQRIDNNDESIESFVRRRLGKEVLERIVQPLVGGIYTGDCAKLSMAATMTQFQKMEREDGSLWAATMRRRREGIDSTERNSAGARYEQFRSFPGGIQELIDALTRSIPRDSIHLGRRVTQINPAEKRLANTATAAPRWQLGGCEDLGDFDHVIIATPAATTARLIAHAAPDAAALVALIESASSAVVAMGVKTSDIGRPIDVAGFIVPAIENRRILAGSFTSDKFAGRAPQGEKLIRVFFGGCLQPEILESSDDQLIQIARAELADLIGLSGQPVFSRVIRWNNAMPQYHVGHIDRLGEIERALPPSTGLHLIGNSFRGVGIAPSVAAAMEVSKRISVSSTDQVIPINTYSS